MAKSAIDPNRRAARASRPGLRSRTRSRTVVTLIDPHRRKPEPLVARRESGPVQVGDDDQFVVLGVAGGRLFTFGRRLVDAVGGTASRPASQSIKVP